MRKLTLAEVTALTRAGTRLIRTWRVPTTLAPLILGGPDQPFDAFLKRLTILVDIHACVRRIFIHPRRSFDWLHRPNAVFDGQSPLQLMARGDMASLDRVRGYLEAELGG
jgi:hypothetical protein